MWRRADPERTSRARAVAALSIAEGRRPGIYVAERRRLNVSAAITCHKKDGTFRSVPKQGCVIFAF